jgi:dTDP-4-dehydrorhamnose reductase
VAADSVDVRAVTVWSAQGAYDWCHLLCQDSGAYEPGAFDLRAPVPRATGLAGVVQGLAEHGTAAHPVLGLPGWWQRSIRLEYPPVLLSAASTDPEPEDLRRPVAHRPLLITGATGTLGRAFARLCELRGLPYRLLTRAEMDIGDPDSVDEVVEAFRPWAIVNAAGYVRVDDAESETSRCFRENAEGAVSLAWAASRYGARYVTFSSDLVFDGLATSPYIESSPTRPLNVYGRSKRLSEEGVLEAHDGALVVRTSAFFGPWDEHNFLHHALSASRLGTTFPAARDYVVSPTYVPDLVQTTLDLLIDGETGLWHLCNRGTVSWAEFAREAVCLAGYSETAVKPVEGTSLGWTAARPRYSAMRSERGWVMPKLVDALTRYLEATEAAESLEQTVSRSFLG